MELQSNEVDKIAAALLAVQEQLTPAVKGSENPFFHSHYASLESVWEAARKPLHDNGIAVAQGGASFDGRPHLVITLLHTSGQWLRGFFQLTPVKDDPQALGSAISYMRRYSLASMVGVVTMDDDAETAMQRDDVLPAFQQESTYGTTTPTGSFHRDNLLGFGKHRDSPWRDIPEDYLEWLLSNGTGDRQKFAEKELAFRNDNDVKDADSTAPIPF